MALEELKAQIATLLTSLEDNPEDVHELQELLRQHLAQLRAMGHDVPQDLAELEARLEQDFGRRKR
jgi:predicted  nucleic acid-binding Zn-ribbon protein